MTKKYVIEFYTHEPKPPEIYYSSISDDMQKLFERIAELTKHKAKFVIHEISKCVADFS